MSCRFEGVIFDFDGTVAFTAEDVWRAIDYAAEREGLAIDPAYRGDQVNLAKTGRQIFVDNFGQLPEQQLQRMCDNLVQHYGYITDYPATYMYPGMKEILERLLEERVPTGIVTNKGEHSLRRILEIKGWGRYFCHLLGADSLGEGHKKPSLMAHMLKTDLAGRSCVYIGDSYSDVTASRENGIPCIGVTYGDGDTEELRAQQPRWLCDDLAQVYNILFEG